MTENWQSCFVADIASPVRNALVGGPFGSNLVSKDYVPTGIPVIRGQNMGERWIGGEFVFVSKEKAKQLSPNTARPGDLIFTQRGTLGQVAIVPEQPYDVYIISQSQMKLTVDKGKVDASFLYYLFKSPEQQGYIIRNTVQTGVPHTNLEHLRTTPLFLPPLPEQRAIAGILGALDDKIELNRRMNRTLESMARVMFRQLFVENPDSSKWDISKIGDLGNLDKGVSYKGAFLTDEGMPMINLGCFQGKGKFDIEKLKPYSGEYKERHTVKPGDIVLANTDITQKREVIGSPAIVPDYPAKEYLFTHHTYALRVKDDSPVLKNYLYFTLLQDEFRERAEGFATGTTVLALPRDAVLDYEISLPPANLLQKFYGQVRPILMKVQNNIKESRTLASLRDSLLPKLMRGEVRVSEL